MIRCHRSGQCLRRREADLVAVSCSAGINAVGTGIVYRVGLKPSEGTGVRTNRCARVRDFKSARSWSCGRVSGQADYKASLGKACATIAGYLTRNNCSASRRCADGRSSRKRWGRSKRYVDRLS